MLVVFVAAAGVGLQDLLLQEHHGYEPGQDQGATGLAVFGDGFGQDMHQNDGQQYASRKGGTEAGQGASVG